MTPDAINLADKFSRIRGHWSPRVVAEMNDYQFKLVKLQGEFVWHTHEDTDEVFMVVHGRMEIGFRDRDVVLNEGEMFVIPRGVEHITRASDECHALIIEPRGVPTPATPAANAPQQTTCGSERPFCFQFRETRAT